MTPKIFFISGLSGSGKSTLVEGLREEGVDLEVHDFDEAGVPDNADEQWRRETTDHWLRVAKENLEEGKSTAIIGLALPGEIRASAECSPDLPIHLSLLRISREEMEKRLRERGWPEDRIKQNLNWYAQVMDELKNESDITFFEGEDRKPERVREEVTDWLTSKKGRR